MSVQVDQIEDNKIYADGLQYITDELGKLDLLIKRRIIEFRADVENNNYDFSSQHMFISNEEIDSLFQEFNINDDTQKILDEIDQEIINQQETITQALLNSEAHGIELPMLRLIRLFNLSDFEVLVLIICLAPELRRKYDRVYAYLQDDITRKRASIDLVLNLLCRSEIEKWRLQNLFTDNAILMQVGLLHLIEDPHSPSGCSNLGRFLKLDPGILSYLLGHNSLDSRLHNVAHLKFSSKASSLVFINEKICQTVNELVDWRFSTESIPANNLVLHFHGPSGVGKKELALMQCERLQCNLLCLDALKLVGVESENEQILRLAFRESMLIQAPLYIEGIDTLCNDENRGLFYTKLIIKLVEEYGWLTFLSGEKSWQSQIAFENGVFKSVTLPMQDFTLRKQAWIKNLESNGEEIDNDMAIQLASQFQLTPGQIHTATEAISFERGMKSNGVDKSRADLVEACRNQSNQQLNNLAVKVDAVYNWDDLILPERNHDLLKQICDQVRQQYKVFNVWGFDKKLSYGKGLSTLFTGPPGTGKTMAAQVLANEIQLDLYKIDLSTVVSKYVGETEKNLSKIFKEAESSNAILFFDEADALFGKRTEVNDAHDRYANIEVSYLLQKMEEYNGIVILASNFRVNMDDAFVRRIRFIIDFPFPDEASRLQIWKIHFPDQAPVAADIDYDLLAKQFTIPGGNIKNVILNAAFQAAKYDTPIAMEHILNGTKHEYEKIGKLWSDGSVSKRSVSQVAR